MVAIYTRPTASQTQQNALHGEDNYDEASKFIASITGYEFLHVERPERTIHMRQALEYINQHGRLGMEESDLELLTLYYTALSEVRRFGGDPVMNPDQGENPATHSLQGVALKERVFSNAMHQLNDRRRKDRLDITATPEHAHQFALHSQLAGLGFLAHDMGEVLGEFSSVAQRSVAGNSIEEDPDAERKVFAYMLRLAAHCLDNEKKGDTVHGTGFFFQEVDRLRQSAGLSDATGASRGVPKTATELDNLLQSPVSLDASSDQRVAQWTAIWDMAERGDSQPMHKIWGQEGANIPFLNQLVKSLDHVQGTRHFIRTGNRERMKEFDGRRVIGQYHYVESEVAPMFAALDGTQPVLEEVGRTQAALVYDTERDLVDLIPPPALAYQILAKKSAIVDPASPLHLPEQPGAQEMKVAQGRIRGLYARARDAVLSGDFTPDLVDNGKGGQRGRLLGIDGLSAEVENALYHGRPLS